MKCYAYCSKSNEEDGPTSVPGSTIRKFFAEIPTTYDWINFLITGGLDNYWRKRAAKLAARNGGKRWLDICAGTGQMTMNLARLARNTNIVALDFSFPMLSFISTSPGQCSIQRCLGDVGALPFPEDCFDLVTVSFATRNLHSDRENLLNRFREIRRVLKPGGRFMNLETSQPSSFLIRKLFHGFIDASVHFIGTFISGSSAPYKYLASSMKTFYFPEELANLLKIAGFKNVGIFPMTFGAVAIHLAWKN